MTLKELKLIDCSQAVVVVGSRLTLLAMFPEEPSADEREQRVWADINSAFSEPVDSTDSTAEYAPTQILGEAFRSALFDGIMYKSSLGKSGINVALFDLSAADVVQRQVFHCDGIQHEFGVSRTISPSVR